jgi:antitoxin component of MazEF toxin-antitoxin module
MNIDQNVEYEYRTIGIIGNSSFCIVLPKKFAINLGVGKGNFVKVRQQENKIIVEKA